ncbi:MAG: hypothetical protein JO061_02470 [Acidobacteriaceae bacterium]|nr:hypothetical protein [Acidobacteriaceae bacterium]
MSYSIPFSQFLLLFSVFTSCQLTSADSFGVPATCRGDGKTDVTACLQQTMIWARHNGQTEVDLPPGTFLVSQPLVILDRIRLFGSGRGDSNYVGTVLRASPSFPAGQPLTILGGRTGGPYYNVQIAQLTLDCAGLAGVGLLNTQAEEHSEGRSLLIEACPNASVDIEGSGAQNSGPFEDLEILPGGASTVSTVCVKVANVISFRGVQDVTCNANAYQTRPGVAFAVDGGSTYLNTHVEHFQTAFSLGSPVNSADGMFVADGQFGPDVDTGVFITGGVANQNLALLGIRCYSCSNLLIDSVTGNTMPQTTSLGWYFLGNGPGETKNVLSSQYGLQTQLYTPVIQGLTAMPALQLTPSSNPADCTESTRGVEMMDESDPSGADHVKVCARLASGDFGWVRIF